MSRHSYSLLVYLPLWLALCDPVGLAAEVAAPIGDGIADDTAAIQQLVSNSTGDIQLAKGVYRITQPIVIELDRVTRTSIHGNGVARIVMAGAGPAFRFIGTHEGTASPSTFQANVWQRQSTPLVDGVEIVGQHPQACGIEASGTMQLTMTRVVVREALHGVHLVKRNRNVTLSECHIYDNHGIGVYLDHLNLHQINIANCHISYNDGGGVVSRNSEIRNLQIGTCDIEGNMGDADSEPTANILLDSTDSSIGEVAIVGCTIQHAHDAPGSANIFINGRSTERPFTDEVRHGNIVIANNVMSDVQVNVRIQHVRGIAITGNTIWKGYDHNLVVTDSKNIVLSGNVFDRNPRYHYGDGAQAKLGLLFKNCQDATLTGNHIYGVIDQEAALVIRSCQRFNITGCSILDYGRKGILLDQVVNSRVTDCLIRDDREAADGFSMQLTDTLNVNVKDNQTSHRVSDVTK
jgi:hypothetical protein